MNEFEHYDFHRTGSNRGSTFDGQWHLPSGQMGRIQFHLDPSYDFQSWAKASVFTLESGWAEVMTFDPRGTEVQTYKLPGKEGWAGQVHHTAEGYHAVMLTDCVRMANDLEAMMVAT